MDADPALARPDKWHAMARGFRLHCPRCGQGALFRSYLKLSEHCPKCGELLGDIRADDIPAWATILVVGHVMVPLFVIAAREDAPFWVGFGILIPASVILTGLLLPRFKGAIASLLWSLGMPSGVPG